MVDGLVVVAAITQIKSNSRLQLSLLHYHLTRVDSRIVLNLSRSVADLLGHVGM